MSQDYRKTLNVFSAPSAADSSGRLFPKAEVSTSYYVHRSETAIAAVKSTRAIHQRPHGQFKHWSLQDAAASSASPAPVPDAAPDRTDPQVTCQPSGLRSQSSAHPGPIKLALQVQSATYQGSAQQPTSRCMTSNRGLCAAGQAAACQQHEHHLAVCPQHRPVLPKRFAGSVLVTPPQLMPGAFSGHTSPHPSSVLALQPAAVAPANHHPSAFKTLHNHGPERTQEHHLEYRSAGDDSELDIHAGRDGSPEVDCFLLL